MTRQQNLHLVGLALAVCAVIGLVLYWASLGGQNVVPGKDYYSIRAMVPTANNLDPYADVREGGVTIGKVRKLDRGPGASTLVTLRLKPKYGPVYRDATVAIRSKSVSEEKYVEINPGHPGAGALPDGATLSAAHAVEPTEFDDVLSILTPPQRAHLRRALGGLGPALLDGRDLNRTLGSSADLVNGASSFASVLSQERGHVAGLIDSFDRVASALGARGAAIQTFTRQAKVTAEAVAARDDAFRAMLRELPAFLAQGRRTAGQLTSFSAGATPVIRDLAGATQQLAPAMRDLRPAAQEGRSTVVQLHRFANAAEPTMRRLPAFSSAGRKFVPPFGDFLREVNPLLAYLDPYWRELGSWFGLEAADTQVADGVGHVVRPTVPLTRSNFSGDIPPELDKALQNMSGPLDTRGTNAYPAPGAAAHPTPFNGSYPRLEPDGPYGR